jgi:hypothetical protein
MQQQLLLEKLLEKHGPCHQGTTSDTATRSQEDPKLTTLYTQLKWKCGQVAGLQEQLAAKHTTERRALESELNELKRLRQATTKATTKRDATIQL